MSNKRTDASVVTVKTLNLKISQLIAENKQLVEEYEKIIEEKDKEIYELKEQNKKLRRGISLLSTEEEAIKKILELRAKGFSPTKIQERLNFIGIDVDLENIKQIVENIDELSPEMILHYKKALEDYEKQIRINPNILKQSSIDEIQFLIDTTKEMIKDTISNSEKSSYMRNLNEYIKTRNQLLKDVIMQTDEEQELLNLLDNEMEEYKETNKIIKFQIDKEEVV